MHIHCARPVYAQQNAEYQGPYLQTLFNVTANFSPLSLEARLPVCSDYPDGCSPLDDTPILLLSPGWAIPRLYFNVIASAIASEGFTVITIDHPEDANIMIYRDGHAVYVNASTWNGGAPGEDVQTRAADASFIIDQLSNTTAMAELLPQRWPRPLPIDLVGMLGHSPGGATAIVAAGQDSRIRGAINWDGTLFGPLPPSGLSQPVLLMMNAVTPIPPDWTAA